MLIMLHQVCCCCVWLLRPHSPHTASTLHALPPALPPLSSPSHTSPSWCVLSPPPPPHTHTLSQPQQIPTPLAVHNAPVLHHH